jgi:hypothetical protein
MLTCEVEDQQLIVSIIQVRPDFICFQHARERPRPCGALVLHFFPPWNIDCTLQCYLLSVSLEHVKSRLEPPMHSRMAGMIGFLHQLHLQVHFVLAGAQ